MVKVKDFTLKYKSSETTGQKREQEKHEDYCMTAYCMSGSAAREGNPMEPVTPLPPPQTTT